MNDAEYKDAILKMGDRLEELTDLRGLARELGEMPEPTEMLCPAIGPDKPNPLHALWLRAQQWRGREC